jgi:hypothetical protein
MGPLSSVSSISFTGCHSLEAVEARMHGGGGRIFVPETHSARDMRTSVRARQKRRTVKMREMETIMNVVVVVISLGLVTSTSANTGMTQKNVVKFYATEVVNELRCLLMFLYRKPLYLKVLLFIRGYPYNCV